MPAGHKFRRIGYAAVVSMVALDTFLGEYIKNGEVDLFLVKDGQAEKLKKNEKTRNLNKNPYFVMIF